MNSVEFDYKNTTCQVSVIPSRKECEPLYQKCELMMNGGFYHFEYQYIENYLSLQIVRGDAAFCERVLEMFLYRCVNTKRKIAVYRPFL